jgi:hypothetical protein
MALVVKDRIKETTTTAGTGTVTLAGASTGFRSFADIGNANTTYYCIAGQGTNEWEVGLGTYTSAGTTLARTTVLSNSLGTTALINFSAGTKDVFVTYPAVESVYQDSLNNAYAPQFGASNGLFINSNTVSASYTIPSNYNAMSAGKVTVNSGITVTIPSGSRWVIV